jgi:hypothetical protein
MQTSIVFGHIKRLPGLNSRPRSSTSYLPQGTTCLEERLLLSGTAPSVSRTALAVRPALAQGPTAVPSIVKAQPYQIVYRNITYTEANGQPEPQTWARNLVFQILEFLDATWNDKIS